MYRQKIEILVQQAKTYLMMARKLPESTSKQSYLKSGKECLEMAMALRKLDKEQITKTYKLTLIKE